MVDQKVCKTVTDASYIALLHDGIHFIRLEKGTDCYVKNMVVIH
jgi:hypothetical protein